MEQRQITVIALALAALVLFVGAVLTYDRPSPLPQADRATAPATVRIDSNSASDKTKVEAPFTRVEKDESGTHIQAPGVDIKVPKDTTKPD